MLITAPVAIASSSTTSCLHLNDADITMRLMYEWWSTGSMGQIMDAVEDLGVHPESSGGVAGAARPDGSR